MMYFRNSFLVTVIGLALGAYLGWQTSHTWTAALSTVFIVAVLATLEVSLSFDNAVVNAAVLRKMSPLWRKRFITWGIAIAVFGMRIVFPLAIVAIIARIGPVSALVMAATDPDNYSRVLTSANVSVSAFGGAFLAMVGLRHFFNREKTLHWITIIERPLTQLGRIEAIIGSMTPGERRNHALINGSRRKRIARGSGTTVEEVNRLLKQFVQMQKMLKSLGGMAGLLFGSKQQYVEKESQFEDLLVRERIKDMQVTDRNGASVKFTEARWGKFTRALHEFDGWSSRLKADFEAAHAWYERLFGRPADNLPMEGRLVEWRVTDSGWVQVTRDADAPARPY